MSDHCHSGSCSTHHHHHHDEGICDCCGKSNHECSCCCDEEEGSHADDLLALADEAWMEVLKEKIKANILKTSGENLDALAKLVSEANHELWKGKMTEDSARNDFEDKLHNHFQQKK